jgi:hypothetical protein
VSPLCALPPQPIYIRDDGHAPAQKVTGDVPDQARRLRVALAALNGTWVEVRR